MLRTHTLNNWWIEQEGQHQDAVALTAALKTFARHDICVLTEGMTYVNQTPGWSGLTSESIKAINPAAKVYRAYTLMSKQKWDTDWGVANPYALPDWRELSPLSWVQIELNNWWLRDGNGEKVHEPELGYGEGHAAKIWYLDVGKPGLKELYLTSLLERLHGKGFEGVVFDYLWPGISFFLDKQGLSRPQAYPTDAVWFEEAWQPFFSYVVNGLKSAGYTVIGNCAGEYTPVPAAVTDPMPPSWSDWQRSLLDGTVYEQFAWSFPPWPVKPLPPEVITRRIKNTPYDSLITLIGDDINKDDPEYERKHRVSLAMYYLSLPVNPEARNRFYYNNRYDGAAHWQPLWDFEIGEPIDRAIQHGLGNRWSRRFTGGRVMLNYTSSFWGIVKGWSLPPYSAAIARLG